MQDIFTKVLEDSVLAGGFLFLLYHVLHKQDQILNKFGNTLEDVSKTLHSLNAEVKELKVEVNNLKGKDDK